MLVSFYFTPPFRKEGKGISPLENSLLAKLDTMALTRSLYPHCRIRSVMAVTWGVVLCITGFSFFYEAPYS